jgi:hypothetical protein
MLTGFGLGIWKIDLLINADALNGHTLKNKIV